jgi:DNA polymerase-4
MQKIFSQVILVNSEAKAILLIDMDSFFASCHAATDESLKKVPAIVASPNMRGIASTANYPAREFGIKSGMPIFKIKELCPNIKIIPPDFKLYVETSDAILKYVYDNFSKKIESVSIDEFYVDVTNVWKKYGSVKKIADTIREGVYKKFNLTCSIGVSTNRFLAKMGSEINKPNGTCVLLPEHVEEKIWNFPVSKMFGIGRATEKILNENNIFTIGDVAKSELNTLTKLLGKRGLTLHQWANGIASDEVKIKLDDSKSISNEMTLTTSTVDLNEIENFYYELCKLVTYRLQKNFLQAKVISIQFKYETRYEIFDKSERQKRTSHQHTLIKQTNNIEEIYSIVQNLFYEAWEKKPIYFVGVTASNLKSSVANVKQIEFDKNFDIPYNEKGISSVVAMVNDLKGQNVIMTGNDYNNLYTKKKQKGGSGLIRVDHDRINEKEILKKWKGE